ncbi:Arm DNA-binding domain-containing protein [Novosphingobium beihaiensis]|uniref:Arm DNA-binding domain-containing protein n=1 Tax=Novosphingobium beihaiensis TaxID=2930389 RepID=UPI0038992675
MVAHLLGVSPSPIRKKAPNHVSRGLYDQNARPKAKAYKLGDGGGLYLQVNPSGTKLWRMKYCNRRANGAPSLAR